MCLGVHFALKNLFGAGDGKLGHLRTQRLLGAMHFLFDLRLGRRQNAVGLGLGVGARLIDRFAFQLFALRDNVGGAGLGSTNISAICFSALTRL